MIQQHSKSSPAFSSNCFGSYNLMGLNSAVLFFLRLPLSDPVGPSGGPGGGTGGCPGGGTGGCPGGVLLFALEEVPLVVKDYLDPEHLRPPHCRLIHFLL